LRLSASPRGGARPPKTFKQLGSSSEKLVEEGINSIQTVTTASPMKRAKKEASNVCHPQSVPAEKEREKSDSGDIENERRKGKKQNPTLKVKNCDQEEHKIYEKKPLQKTDDPQT